MPNGDWNVPAGITFDLVMDLLSEVRDRPQAPEDDLSKRVKDYSTCKSALIAWGLVESTEKRLALTPAGRDVAYAKDQERAEGILNHVVVRYAPYEIVLSTHLKEYTPALDTDRVLQIWGKQLGIAISRDWLSRAAALMYQVMEAAGLGTYIVGRAGKKTRIEFNEGADGRVRSAIRASISAPAPEKDVELPGASAADARMEPATRAAPPASQERRVEVSAPARNYDGWETITTDWFELRIKRQPEAWTVLNMLLPAYEKASASLMLSRTADKKRTENGDDSSVG